MNMFKPTNAKTVEEYINQISEPRKSEILKLHKLIMENAPGYEPFIAYGIIGYGKTHYKTKSGREGDWFVIGLASQKNYISIYSCATSDGKYVAEKNRDILGKASVGRSCIRYKKFEDIPINELKKVIKETIKEAKAGNIIQ